MSDTGLIFRPELLRLIAVAVLAIYFAVAFAYARRELQFLRSVPAKPRKLFIAQDVLVQVGVLLLLVPIIIQPDLSELTPATLTTWLLVIFGFTLLWAATIWMAFSRYMYAKKMLLEQLASDQERLQELLAKAKTKQGQDEGATSAEEGND